MDPTEYNLEKKYVVSECVYVSLNSGFFQSITTISRNTCRPLEGNVVLKMLVPQDWYERIPFELWKLRNIWVSMIKQVLSLYPSIGWIIKTPW